MFVAGHVWEFLSLIDNPGVFRLEEVLPATEKYLLLSLSCLLTVSRRSGKFAFEIGILVFLSWDIISPNWWLIAGNLPLNPSRNFSSASLTAYISSKSRNRSIGSMSRLLGCCATFSFCAVIPWLRRSSHRIWIRSAMRSTWKLVKVEAERMLSYQIWEDGQALDGSP